VRDALEKGLGISLQRDASRPAVEGGLAESETRLDLLGDLLRGLFSRRAGADPSGLPLAVVVDENSPGAVAFSHHHPVLHRGPGHAPHSSVTIAV